MSAIFNIARQLQNKENSSVLPTIVLENFAPKATIDFGSVKDGSEHTQQLKITNPSTSACRVAIDKVPTRAGFYILGDKQRWAIPSKSSVVLDLHWEVDCNKIKGQGVREKLSFKYNQRFRAEAILVASVNNVSSSHKRKEDIARKRSKSSVKRLKLNNDHGAHADKENVGKVRRSSKSLQRKALGNSSLSKVR